MDKVRKRTWKPQMTGGFIKRRGRSLRCGLLFLGVSGGRGFGYLSRPGLLFPLRTWGGLALPGTSLVLVLHLVGQILVLLGLVKKLFMFIRDHFSAVA